MDEHWQSVTNIRIGNSAQRGRHATMDQIMDERRPVRCPHRAPGAMLRSSNRNLSRNCDRFGHIVLHAR
jgi:hypothetical protein